MFVWARSCRGSGGNRRPVCLQSIWNRPASILGTPAYRKCHGNQDQIVPLLTIMVGKVCLNGDRRALSLIPRNYHLIQGRRQRITGGLGGLSTDPAVWHEYMKTSERQGDSWHLLVHCYTHHCVRHQECVDGFCLPMLSNSPNGEIWTACQPKGS